MLYNKRKGKFFGDFAWDVIGPVFTVFYYLKRGKLNIMQRSIDRIAELKLVPVVILNRIEDALPDVGALKKGGLPVAEITFRTACAADAIKLLNEKEPDILLGAGTVINAKQCREAIACGAKFIVSPGLSESVAEVCAENDMLYIPGVATPTEIMKAIDLGLDVVKFFPASNYGGIKAIKAISAAFPSVRFTPTGGINEDNLSEYLAFDKVLACGGSWMLKGSPAEIEGRTRRAVDIIKNCRR